MNTVQELHIALDIELQHLNSNRRRGLLAEEKDMILNNAVMICVNNKARDGEDRTKRIRDIQSLKVSTPVILPVYYGGNNYMYSILPVDWLEYNNSFSVLQNNCSPINATTETVNETIFRFNLGNGGSGQLKYNNFKVGFTTGEVIFEYPVSTIYSENGKFILIQKLLSHINSTKVFSVGGGTVKLSAYYEYYDDLYHLGNILIVVEESTIVLTTTSLLVTQNGGIIPSTKNQLARERYVFAFTNTKERTNDLKSSFDIRDELNNPYSNKNRYLSPLSTINNNRLLIYHNDTFIIKEVGVEYYKKPILIDYKTGQMPKLQYNEVISIATQLAKSYMSDPSYEITKDINTIIE